MPLTGGTLTAAITNHMKLYEEKNNKKKKFQFEVYTPSFRLNFRVLLPIPSLLILNNIFPHMTCS